MAGSITKPGWILFAIVAIAVLSVESISFEAESMCDWKQKLLFRQCLLTKYPIGSPAENLIAMLRDEGFVEAARLEDNDPYYFKKIANNLSGYKIAVIIYLDGTNISRLLVR